MASRKAKNAINELNGTPIQTFLVTLQLGLKMHGAKSAMHNHFF
jgi:hypothetical protein